VGLMACIQSRDFRVLDGYSTQAHNWGKTNLPHRRKGGSRHFPRTQNTEHRIQNREHHWTPQRHPGHTEWSDKSRGGSRPPRLTSLAWPPPSLVPTTGGRHGLPLCVPHDHGAAEEGAVPGAGACRGRHWRGVGLKAACVWRRCWWPMGLY